MSSQSHRQSLSRRLLQCGVGLFLLGLLTGFMMPIFQNPRMGLASHLEGVLNGMFLISLGLLWSRLVLSRGLQRLTLGLVIFGTFANWFVTLLAAIWGAGSMMTIAASGFTGTPWQEMLIGSLLFVLSFAMISVCGLVFYGLRTNLEIQQEHATLKNQMGPNPASDLRI